MYRPSEVELTEALEMFLARNNISGIQLDAWINGSSGSKNGDKMLDGLGKRLLASVPHTRFKHLSGEYCTAVSFGLWLGARMLREQVVPQAVRIEPFTMPDNLNRILIANHYLNKNYSFLLLER